MNGIFFINEVFSSPLRNQGVTVLLSTHQEDSFNKPVEQIFLNYSISFHHYFLNQHLPRPRLRVVVGEDATSRRDGVAMLVFVAHGESCAFPLGWLWEADPVCAVSPLCDRWAPQAVHGRCPCPGRLPARRGRRERLPSPSRGQREWIRAERSWLHPHPRQQRILPGCGRSRGRSRRPQPRWKWPDHYRAE